MGKVIYPRKGEVHTVPVVFTAPANFADATWAEIIEACERNAVPSTWEVGDQKAMTINGVDYMIDIIGKNHDTYTSGGTAPLTFQMHDLYISSSVRMNSTITNVGGWTSCEMRVTTLPSILAKMPSEVQSGIKKVNKLTSAGNASSTINTTSDGLFLLSEIEVFGTNTYSKSGEGNQYEYYSSGNSAAKTRKGTSDGWWLRSPQSGSTTRFCQVNNSGKIWAYDSNTYESASFAFCF